MHGPGFVPKILLNSGPGANDGNLPRAVWLCAVCLGEPRGILAARSLHHYHHHQTLSRTRRRSIMEIRWEQFLRSYLGLRVGALTRAGSCCGDLEVKLFFINGISPSKATGKHSCSLAGSYSIFKSFSGRRGWVYI